MSAEAFLTASEEAEIINAIREAELLTSGEIRVHLESKGSISPMQRVKDLFHILKMDNTKEENGVLIYVAVDDRKFAIYGDKGIDQVTPEDFWESTLEGIRTHFKQGKYKDGLVAGIASVGKELAAYFPWEHGDRNELDDEISKS